MSKKKGKKKAKKVEISVYGNGHYLGDTVVTVGKEYKFTYYVDGISYVLRGIATGEDVYLTAPRRGSQYVGSVSEGNAFSEEFPGTGKAMAAGVALGFAGFDF